MIIQIDDLNRELVRNPAAFAMAVNAAYDKRIEGLARDIFAHRQEHPIVLIAGPSGSGKTTTALKLEQLLDSWGCSTHTLSMDNYFAPFSPEEHRLAARGGIDLESPARVDADLLNSQLRDMIAGKPVSLPKYDFATSSRLFPGNILTRKSGELVIIEGIHALNPEVITLDEGHAARLYISVRTRVTDGTVVLHPSRIRLLRRMARDRLYRSRSIEETMLLFDNVERGEARYIMPHKHRATHEIDTFFDYEIAAYRPLLLRDLLALPEEERAPIRDLVRILEHSAPMRQSDIPKESMIREFIGNGQFAY